MSEESSNIDFCKEYLHDVYVNQNISTIDRLLQENTLYYAEFGQALGARGVKSHVKCWHGFFKLNNIDIKILDSTDRGVTAGYSMFVQQQAVFKGIEPTKKVIHVRGSISMAINNQKVVHYYLKNDLSHLISQLVDDNQEKHRQVMNTPIFSTPYDVHMEVITEHLNAHSISITKSQVKYLCAYYCGVTDVKAYGLSEIPEIENDNHEQEIKNIFKCKDRTQICDKLNAMQLSDLLNEGFMLLGIPSLPFYDQTQPHFGVSTSLTDNSKYLL